MLLLCFLIFCCIRSSNCGCSLKLKMRHTRKMWTEAQIYSFLWGPCIVAWGRDYNWPLFSCLPCSHSPIRGWLTGSHSLCQTQMQETITNLKLEWPLPFFFVLHYSFPLWGQCREHYPASMSLLSIEFLSSAHLPARSSVSWILPVVSLLHHYESASTWLNSQGCSAIFIR